MYIFISRTHKLKRLDESTATFDDIQNELPSVRKQLSAFCCRSSKSVKPSMNILSPAMIFALGYLYATTALANAGLPVVVIQGPFLLFLILPVVLLETLILKSYTGLSFSRCCKVVGSANAVSTFIGIPITYALVLFFEYALGMAGFWIGNVSGQVVAAAGHILFPALLVPFSDELFLPSLAIAGIILMIFFFFVSWKVEFLVATRMLSSDNIPKSKLNSIFMRANIASYLGMTLIWIGYIFVVIMPIKG